MSEFIDEDKSEFDSERMFNVLLNIVQGEFFDGFKCKCGDFFTEHNYHEHIISDSHMKNMVKQRDTILCKDCNKKISMIRWETHILTKTHLNNIDKHDKKKTLKKTDAGKTYCEDCKKELFTRNFARHLESTTHKKNAKKRGGVVITVSSNKAESPVKSSPVKPPTKEGQINDAYKEIVEEYKQQHDKHEHEHEQAVEHSNGQVIERVPEQKEIVEDKQAEALNDTPLKESVEETKESPVYKKQSKVHCDECNRDITKSAWNRHIGSKAHLDKVKANPQVPPTDQVPQVPQEDLIEELLGDNVEDEQLDPAYAEDDFVSQYRKHINSEFYYNDAY